MNSKVSFPQQALFAGMSPRPWQLTPPALRRLTTTTCRSSRKWGRQLGESALNGDQLGERRSDDRPRVLRRVDSVPRTQQRADLPEVVVSGPVHDRYEQVTRDPRGEPLVGDTAAFDPLQQRWGDEQEAGAGLREGEIDSARDGWARAMSFSSLNQTDRPSRRPRILTPSRGGRDAQCQRRAGRPMRGKRKTPRRSGSCRART